MDKTVCVVGNALSALGLNNGADIDSYENVVRCNWFKTDGYESDVGTKITHWAIVCAMVERAKDRHILGYDDCSQLQQLWVRYYPNHNDLNNFISRLSGIRELRLLLHHRASLWPDYIRNMCWPTTGLLAIITAIEKWGPPVTVIGFGSREEFEKGHYFGPVHRSKNRHDMEEERLLMLKLEDDGLIYRLD